MISTSLRVFTQFPYCLLCFLREWARNISCVGIVIITNIVTVITIFIRLVMVTSISIPPTNIAIGLVSRTLFPLFFGTDGLFAPLQDDVDVYPTRQQPQNPSHPQLLCPHPPYQ